MISAAFQALLFSFCQLIFSSVQSLSRIQLFVTPWIEACQASLSITNSQSSLRLPSIESMMPSSHLILSHPLLLLPTIPPSIRVFSNKSTLHKRWPKYWSFSFSIIPSKEIPGLQTTLFWPCLCLNNHPRFSLVPLLRLSFNTLLCPEIQFWDSLCFNLEF